jgi:hypothetical protein
MSTPVVAATEQRIDVRAFGAIGDGIVDDKAAIEAAFRAAVISGIRTVYFPAGTYRVALSAAKPGSTDQITIPGDIRIVGAGRAASTIRFDPGADNFAWSGLRVDPRYSLELQDLALRGPDRSVGNLQSWLVFRDGARAGAVYDSALRVTDCDMIGEVKAVLGCASGTLSAWSGRLLLELRGCRLTGWQQCLELYNNYASVDGVVAFHAYDCRFEGAGIPAALSPDGTDQGHQIYLSPNVSAILEDCFFGGDERLTAQVFAIKWYGASPIGVPQYARLTRCTFGPTVVNGLQVSERVGVTTLVEDCTFTNLNAAISARGSVTVRRCTFSQGGAALVSSQERVSVAERAANVTTLEDCRINSGTISQPYDTSTLRLVRCILTGAGPASGVPRIQNQGAGTLELIDCKDLSVASRLVGATTGVVLIRGCTFQGRYAAGAIAFDGGLTLLTLENNDFYGQEKVTSRSHAFYTSTSTAPQATQLKGGGNTYRAEGWTSMYRAERGGLPGGIPAALWDQ